MQDLKALGEGRAISQEYKDPEKDLMLGKEGRSGSGILDKSP